MRIMAIIAALALIATASATLVQEYIIPVHEDLDIKMVIPAAFNVSVQNMNQPMMDASGEKLNLTQVLISQGEQYLARLNIMEFDQAPDYAENLTGIAYNAATGFQNVTFKDEMIDEHKACIASAIVDNHQEYMGVWFVDSRTMVMVESRMNSTYSGMLFGSIVRA